MEENLIEQVDKSNKRLVIWSIIFFGLMIQTIQNWSWFFSPGNYIVFIFIGLWFIIGYIGYILTNLKIKKLTKKHSHEFNEKSLICEKCGIIWDLKSCPYCNSKNFTFIKKNHDFEYFTRISNVMECKDCNKSIEIDSYKTAKVKGVKK